MNNCLILLTNYYPFHKGEEYLESEIEFLSEEFKDIIILVTMKSPNMKQTRKVPKNCKIISSNLYFNPIGKAKMFFKHMNKVSHNKNLFNGKENFAQRLYAKYFEARSIEVYNSFEKQLKNIAFEKYSSITIYSYWLYITANVAIKLRENLLKNVNNVKTISRAHRYDLYEDAAPLKYLPQRNFLLSKLDHIFPCSQDGVDYINKTNPGFEKKVEVRRLGTMPRKVSEKKGIEMLNIVTCSVMRKVKRLDLLIDALKILQDEGIKFHWTHIGGGSEFKKISKLAKKKLDSNNYYFTGQLKNEEVLEWYQKNPATVFVNVSSSEGVPVSIMEAMSMGLPVIATDVGGTREILKNGVSGFLLKSNPLAEEISNVLRKFYQLTYEEYSSMCKNSYMLWNKNCNAVKLYTEFAAEISGHNYKNKKLYNRLSE
ncbi:glycosyltransferase [Aeribacillus sp. FSL K6-8210]|uniref:glycosyltransferase n=1 Tax=Aeribacillus sp. FSL K6-8210 TaxID=2954683 RepID=UPI0030CDC79A